MLDTDWRDIPVFPKYQVGNLGNILTIKTGRILHPSLNNQGILKVNLVKGGEVYTRSVNHLVGKAFLDPPTRRDFSSLIHLDGDRTNCAVDNLMWRPRYFAIKYHNQFEMRAFQDSVIPIIDIKTQEKYDRIQDACVRHGLLFQEIIIAMHERTYVWPTFQEFATLGIK